MSHVTNLIRLQYIRICFMREVLFAPHKVISRLKPQKLLQIEHDQWCMNAIIYFSKYWRNPSSCFTFHHISYIHHIFSIFVLWLKFILKKVPSELYHYVLCGFTINSWWRIHHSPLWFLSSARASEGCQGHIFFKGIEIKPGLPSLTWFNLIVTCIITAIIFHF